MAINIPNNDSQRLKVVVDYANNVLKKGRGDSINSDRIKKSSPLFVDGLKDGEPFLTSQKNGKKFISSNMAYHQNLFRVFYYLSEFTGEKTYKDAAVAELEYHYNKLIDKSGLLHWGGHDSINLENLQAVGHVHELKNVTPFYEMMFEVDKDASKKFIEALWNSHVFDWEKLEISRHGRYGETMGKLWDNCFDDPEPFRETIGLSFRNIGNDLIYAAAKLYQLTDNEKVLTWCKRLARMYVKARNEKTGLGSYKFTQAMKREEPTADSNTLSGFGDRAKRQFGPEFGESALEGNIITAGLAATIYSLGVNLELEIYEDIGKDAEEFLQWSRDALMAFKKYAYISETNMLRPMISDGTDLSNYILPRDGYYGKKGNVIRQFPADSKYMYSYARAFRLTEEGVFWDMVRNIASHFGLGDLGNLPGKNISINLSTDNSDPVFIFALLEVFKHTECNDYIKLAESIASNIIYNYFEKGNFIDNSSDIILFDKVDPLALLSLNAVKSGNLKYRYGRYLHSSRNYN